MKLMRSFHHDQRLLFISTYPPQQCGIATFTRDLASAVAARLERGGVDIAAVSEEPAAYSYPDEVALAFNRNERMDFRAIADYVNFSDYDAVCVQHEFGIFGGEEGSYLLDLLGGLRKPVVTTFHTVLAGPAQGYHRRLRQVADASDAVVVLTPTATRLLHGIYGVSPRKVRVIPHGIPDVPFADPERYKRNFGVEGRMVVMTFGLIGPSKGIEEMIEAMPAVVERHPEVIYMIVGATHPGIIAREGEVYRRSLEQKVRELGVQDNVVFHNKYLSDDELRDYLNACDIYVTPYPNREQISSGTLAYATGMGKAVISTPYWYAQDLLADGRGRLVDFHSSSSLARAIIDLVKNDDERNAMRRRAFEFGRKMCWSQVAEDYLQLFGELRSERAAGMYRSTRRPAMPARSGVVPVPPGRIYQVDAMSAYQALPPGK